MRGRNIANSFILLDEAQNCTYNQLKMFLTRLGKGSKMVICGDITQIDLMRGQSGLQKVMSHLEDIAEVGQVVAFLASDESSYMTGQAINITGGQLMEL